MEYEGEYLLDKKFHGKGYDEYGNIIYQLKNGTGKVKEYNWLGKLDFEGEYLNGLRNGKGKEYDLERLIFEGEYLNGKRNGKGKEYDLGKLIFEGEFLNNKRNGKGKDYGCFNGKLLFEGEYFNNIKYNGKGFDEEGNIIYELKNGTGKVKEYNYYGYLEFEGEYLNGLRNGKGKEYKYGELIFEGEYLNGFRK